MKLVLLLCFSPAWLTLMRWDGICAASLIIVMSESSNGYKPPIFGYVLHVNILEVTTLGGFVAALQQAK